jgi:hypothetical protein
LKSPTSKINSVVSGCLVVLFSSFISVANQAAESAEPKYRLTPRPPPDVTNVEDLWSGGVDQVAWWINLWGEESVRSDVRTAINAKIQREGENLRWTGGGVLLRQEVIRQYNDETPLTSVGMLGDGAVVVGYGQTKEDAWIQNRSGGTVEARLPDGWKIDDVMSAYLWVQRSPDGTLTRTGVPKGTLLTFDKQMQDNWGVYYGQYLQRKTQNLQEWKQVAATAQQRLRDQAARDAITKSLNDVQASKQRVADSMAKLQQALDSAQQGAAALSFLRTMQGVVQVAQLGQMASNMLGADPANFSGASSGDAVITTAESIQGDRVTYSMKMEATFDGNFTELQNFLSKLWSQVQPANPPPSASDAFSLTKP